jgi:TniQ protein
MHMHTITPLPLRIEPQPWEELASFLARTARHMQYAHTSWLLQPELAKQRMTSRNLSLLAAQDDYTFLSDLLALSEEQIYHMTIHPLDVLSRHLLCFPPFQRGAQKPSPPTISNGTPINRPTLSRQVYQFSCLTSGTTQICPLCLQEPVPYDRLYWKTKYLITCASA